MDFFCIYFWARVQTACHISMKSSAMKRKQYFPVCSTKQRGNDRWTVAKEISLITYNWAQKDQLLLSKRVISVGKIESVVSIRNIILINCV